MRNFAAFIQDRLSYEAFHREPRPALVIYDGNIPEQQGGGGRWFPVTTYPEIDPGYAWNTLAPRTGLVWKITSDGKNVAKASYSRYYEGMYGRVLQHQPEHDQHDEHSDRLRGSATRIQRARREQRARTD